MKIKKLFYLFTPLIAITSVATIVATSCNKSNGISTSSVMDKITQEYFDGPNGRIDANTQGFLQCVQSDALPNELSAISYWFTPTEVADVLTHTEYLDASANIDSIVSISTQLTEKDSNKKVELMAIQTDPNSTQEQVDDAFEKITEIQLSYSVTFIKGTFSFMSYETYAKNVQLKPVSKNIYNKSIKKIKKADKNYDVLAEKLFDMWNAVQPTL
ncbi:MAG: hypothetical protein Ta2E_03530 [Mycoplasmoidaceae bacterium]|nr:MAG: hypothetical protein Ta2E_03530 [Mycoplasmoidaceae bacterium]